MHDSFEQFWAVRQPFVHDRAASDEAALAGAHHARDGFLELSHSRRLPEPMRPSLTEQAVQAKEAEFRARVQGS